MSKSAPLWDQPSVPPSVPTDTSTLAGQQAAAHSGSWRRRILDTLRTRGPLALFELAELFGVPDHIISGRVTDLRRDGHIEPTGERRRKPSTGCQAEVYRIAGAAASGDGGEADPGDLLGYPDVLRVGEEMYDRQRLSPGEGYPGIPYATRRDSGGPRQLVRVELVECPGCGQRLHFRQEGAEKYFDCRNDNCGQTWRLRIAQIPGRSASPALMMETFR